MRPPRFSVTRMKPTTTSPTMAPMISVNSRRTLSWCRRIRCASSQRASRVVHSVRAAFDVINGPSPQSSVP